MQNHTCGVYRILNLCNGRVYVGQSVDVERRCQEHKRKLMKGSHDNPHLQNAWNKYGEESFSFSIVEETIYQDLADVEQFYMDYYDSCNSCFGYNLMSASVSNYRFKFPRREFELAGFNEEEITFIEVRTWTHHLSSRSQKKSRKF